MPTKNTIALLERARAMCDPPTWYQLAKTTGIKQQTLSRCVTQDKTLGDINAVKLGKFLGMDAATVMAYMAEDRAQDAPTKAFWSAQLPRLLPSFAFALAGLTATGVSLNDGSRAWTKAQLDRAAQMCSEAWAVSQPIHYAQRLGLNLLDLILLAWAALELSPRARARPLATAAAGIR
jgi:hypothetical protein